MLKTTVATLMILSALLLLSLSHWIVGRPTASATVQISRSPDDRYLDSVSGIRLGIMWRSTQAIIDSICALEAIRPPEGVVRALEDESREMFLRGAIERRGFVMSLQMKILLQGMGQARSAFLVDLEHSAVHQAHLQAVREVNGPLLDLRGFRHQRAILPAILRREATLLGPGEAGTLSARRQSSTAYPTAATYDLYYEWLRAVDAYDQGYNRDLIERAIVAAAVFRNATVISGVTDSLGGISFPNIDLGRYWLTGFYPPDLFAMRREHRRFLSRARAGQGEEPTIITWDHLFTLTGPETRIDLTQSDALPTKILLPGTPRQ